ncbi:MAG TPA: RNA 2',3'-cyclic phosphodiesterase [Ignavibacteriales bacterium]|nr:RNA 2',3'-cyclic phosphodiesterase [Ignavibacteriales bacterium]HOL80391.1 RNA 2',3'-cyclic phosphodiesterase [Ignavibacteriales bacterium]HOM64842.1 RNA 2',3'-cyclic phosphodiesterase [Ignavibacteriales bacterium]HPD67425.1 RNA 2',3'-cyclic phosphodiesterase [Ignavibacteriales bacterium]HPP32580.1 RNA 2',3'-cyclic phosphodiesterase [Ignavibacteriales bacterium]
MTERLFIAFDLDEQTKSYISDLIDELSGLNKYINWETEDKFHVTLSFLGDTDVSKVDNLNIIINKLANNNKPIKTYFEKFQIFDIKNKYSILNIKLNLNKYFENSVRQLNQLLKNGGFVVNEKRFNPHITILRIKNKLKGYDFSPFLNYKFEPEEITLNNIVLFKSTLTPKGSIYTPLYSKKLI